MSKCEHCKARLEWPVRIDPDTGTRIQLPPCDAEPAWAIEDPAGRELGFEPRRLAVFVGIELTVEQVAENYWRGNRIEVDGRPARRIWRLHRCAEGEQARQQRASEREEAERQRAEEMAARQRALW